MKSLPARPSLDSLRKQAKKLARDIASGDAGAMARARVHLPNVDRPLTQRNAQLVIAREYGYAGWQDLTAEVSKRLGKGLEWAVTQARRAIHDNDVERLKQLLAEYPALLSWRGNDDDASLLGFATGAYGDAGDPERERWFTRAASAELLIDAGAVATPSVSESILQSRARGLLQLFHRKGLLPTTLKFFAALGDLDAVRTALDENANDLAAVNEAFVRACGFHHEAVASLLLERSIALDPELRKNVEGGVGRVAFIKHLIETRTEFVREIGGHATTVGLWKAFVLEQVSRAILDDDLRLVRAHPGGRDAQLMPAARDLLLDAPDADLAIVDGDGRARGRLDDQRPLVDLSLERDRQRQLGTTRDHDRLLVGGEAVLRDAQAPFADVEHDRSRQR